jgi:hypothetical protein
MTIVTPPTLLTPLTRLTLREMIMVRMMDMEAGESVFQHKYCIFIQNVFN